MPSAGRSFGFNGSAVAFGGLIRPSRGKQSKPIQGRVQPPSVALSPAGGRVESVLRNYNEDGIKFKNARTFVEGKIEGDSLYTTTAIASLEDLDIFGVVTADAITSTVQSQRDTSQGGDTTFTLKAKFTNLRIDGKRVNPALDLALFQQVPTYRDFIRFFSNGENMENFGKAWGWRLNGAESAPEMFRAAADTALSSPEPIRCSLVTRPVAGGFRQDGYALLLPENLGTVHLAEVLVKPVLRRVNMLRLDIRKPGPAVKSATARRTHDDDTYNATICSGEGNGSESIPP